MNATILVAIAGLVLTAVFYQQAMDLPSVAQRLPVLLIWIVAGLAVLMIIEEVLKKRRYRQQQGMTDDDTQIESSAAEKTPINWVVVVPFVLAVFVYIALIPVVGYLLTTVVFLVGVLALSHTVSWPKAILIGVGITLFVWVIFVWLLRLPVPLFPWSS